MKTAVRKCIVSLLTLAFAFTVQVQAQQIRDIQTVVNLFGNGNAQVVQKWDVNVVKGTERYIPIDNPGKSYVHDFRVFENGKEYENEGRQWNTDRSLEEKAHRCGIVEKNNGNIELCWGQGEYGDHVYTISYIIDNLVQSFDDCDGFHWHFLNDEWSDKPQHASIIIRNETDRDPWYWESKDSCNVNFWGFGMAGESWIDDGMLCFESTEPFKYESFFSALVRFDKGLFSEGLVKSDKSFQEVKDEAMHGSDYEDEEASILDKIIAGLFLLVIIGIPVLIVGYLIFSFLRNLYRKATGKRFDKKIFGQNKIEGWWRDVPLGGSPTALYSLLVSGDYLCSGEKKMFSNVVSAYFLKWIQDGWVSVEKDPKKEERVNLRFVSKKEDIATDDRIEKEVYAAALTAAGENLLLEADEFKKWSYQNDVIVASWPSEAKTEGKKTWSSANFEERCNAVKFGNFLNDFTLSSEREAPEVGVWKQYMIMAAALGIADKVSRNFEKLFPTIMEQYARQTNMVDTATTYIVLNNITSSSSSMMSSAVSRQEERAAAAAQARRAAGGGGSISIGGGHGGFGGGHGGGSR